MSSHMRPASGLLKSTIPVKLIETCVGIGLQRAAKLLQVLFGMLALAIRRVSEPHRGSGTVARRTIIANISPQSSRLRLALARSQYRHRRVIGVQFAGGHHVAT